MGSLTGCDPVLILRVTVGFIQYVSTFLVYGRQAWLPVEFSTRPTKEVAVEDEEEEKLQGVRVAYQQEGHYISKEALTNKSDIKIPSSAKTRENTKLGALALVKNCKKSSWKVSKMEPNCLGPFSIIKVLNKGWSWHSCAT